VIEKAEVQQKNATKLAGLRDGLKIEKQGEVETGSTSNWASYDSSHLCRLGLFHGRYDRRIIS
jgi:hypothetical protein